MPKLIEAGLSAQGKRFALIASRFYDFITVRLFAYAVDALFRNGAPAKDKDEKPAARPEPLVASVFRQTSLLQATDYATLGRCPRPN